MLVVKTKEENESLGSENQKLNSETPIKKEIKETKKEVEKIEKKQTKNKVVKKKVVKKKTTKKSSKSSNNSEPPKKPKKNKNSDGGIWDSIKSFFSPKKPYLWILIGLILIIGIVWIIAVATTENVPVDLYVMSMCPYGTQAEDAVIPAARNAGADINLYFIATENADGTFNSLHGSAETAENIRQLCALEQNKDKALDYILCRNENLNGNWEACAKDVGLNVEILSKCASGDEGRLLLSENIQIAIEKGISASPTIFIGEEQYSGSRDEDSFKQAICDAHTGAKPFGCLFSSQKSTQVILLNDERCVECDTTQLVAALEQVIPGLKVKEVDYSSSTGRNIYEETGVIYLPVVLFDKDVEGESFYSQLSPYFDDVGDYYSLRVGAVFDPTMEICYNGIDDTNNGLVDCEDPECEGSFDCREEELQRLDVFVMSMCPYGKLALDAMEEVFDNFGRENVDFNIYFIATENADGTFNSLHGQPEVEEDLREVCAIENYPISYQYMDYIWCRNEDMNADWTVCAEKANMDVELIRECSEGDEGKFLLGRSLQVSQNLGIGASPTWIANNKYMFNGIDAETVKTNFCAYNNVEGCDSTLTGNTGTVSGQC